VCLCEIEEEKQSTMRFQLAQSSNILLHITHVFSIINPSICNDNAPHQSHHHYSTVSHLAPSSPSVQNKALAQRAPAVQSFEPSTTTPHNPQLQTPTTSAHLHNGRRLLRPQRAPQGHVRLRSPHPQSLSTHGSSPRDSPHHLTPTTRPTMRPDSR
jgi:hypothetical protein